MTYGNGRYEIVGADTPDHAVCLDKNLSRPVSIHWVETTRNREAVRSRLASLQLVRTPYLALIYDLVESRGRVGVVEEQLGECVAVTTNPIGRLYQFCAGLAALHEQGLAHGALSTDCFRLGSLNSARLCNLAFGGAKLDEPSTDLAPFSARLATMGVGRISDSIFQALLTRLHPSPASEATSVVAALRTRLAALLLNGRHRALVNWRGTAIELGAENRQARFTHAVQDVASITIEYDGTRFLLAIVSGEVLVNNIPAVVGGELPSSCVISLGGSHRPPSMRYFVTFDQSHPEVLNATH